MAMWVKVLPVVAALALFDAYAGVQVCGLNLEGAAAVPRLCAEDSASPAQPAATDPGIASGSFQGHQQRLRPAELTGSQRVLVREGILPGLDDPRARFGVMVGNQILRDGRLHHIAVCGFVELPDAVDDRRGGQLFYGWLLPQAQQAWTFAPMPFSTSAETQAMTARLCAEDGVSS